MKRLTVGIEMNDDSPEGTSLLVALGALVQEATRIVEKKTMIVKTGFSDPNVRVKCKWTAHSNKTVKDSE